MTRNQLIEKTKELFKCDEVRLTKPLNTIFVILGWKKHSSSEWYDQDNNLIEFDYIHEQVIAHGKTCTEAWKDVQYYKKLCDESKIKRIKNEH